MPVISEDSFFFIKVEAICHRPAITCPVDLGLVEMSRIMKRDNISGIVVVDQETPIGMVSLRDLRDLVAEGVDDITTLTVRDIMHLGLITIRRTDYLFKAIFLMAKHNIHRLVVVDEFDHLVGVMTDTDLFRIQTRSPMYLIQQIDSANTIAQLSMFARKMTGMLQYAVKTTADVQSLVQLIAHFNDAITRRLIHILEHNEGMTLPAEAAYLALGSEGREEQTLRTDQDSAIVYQDNLAPETVDGIRRFAERISLALNEVGVPLCPGNMMASNPAWCHSISEWKHLVTHWITSPGPDQTVFFGVFQDLRVLHGDIALEEELRNYICECTHNHAIFFPNMARTITGFKAPLGLFGRLLVEKSGQGRGMIDLKKGGLFALTRGISLLALEERICGGTTWSKIERLRKCSHIAPGELDLLEESFTFLVRMRLEKQLSALARGLEPGNFVDPKALPDKDKDQLRAAFRGASAMLDILKSHYQLDLVAR